MSSTNNQRKDHDRHLRVRGVRRTPPDLRKLASALIALAQAQAEADAATEHAKREQAGRALKRQQPRPGGKGAA